MSKPRVITKCVANAYTGDGERIIEFAHKGKGGLIAFLELPDGPLLVNVYRCDAGIEVRGSQAPEVAATLAGRI